MLDKGIFITFQNTTKRVKESIQVVDLWSADTTQIKSFILPPYFMMIYICITGDIEMLSVTTHEHVHH